MRYDFETLVNRWEQGAVKWDMMKESNPKVPENIVPFSVADMEFKNPPEIIEGLKAFLDEVVLGYPKPTEKLRDIVTNWISRRYGWEAKKEWLVFTSGVVSAFFHGVLSFTEPGDGVILLTPVYYPFYNAIQKTERTLVRCPLNNEEGKYTINFELLEELAEKPENKMMIFCNPHNPVGRVWTKEEVEKVVSICKKHNLFLISDEIHCDLIMPEHQFTSSAVAAGENKQHLMVCYAPSKTFNLAGMRTSCIVVPDEKERTLLQESMERVAQSGPGILGLKACEIAYSQCDEWLKELLQVLNENKEYVTAFIKERLPKVRVTEMEGTYLLWIDLRAYGFSKEEQERIMTEEAFMFLDEGYVFGDEGIGFERINLACPKKVLEEAMERLAAALAPYEN